MAKINTTGPIVVPPKWKRDQVAAIQQPAPLPQPDLDDKKKKPPTDTLAIRG